MKAKKAKTTAPTAKIKSAAVKTTAAKPKSAAKAVVKPGQASAAKKKVAAVKRPARKIAPKIPPILMEGDTPPPPSAHGPGQRYALGPTAPPAHAAMGEPGELPEAYGTKRLLVAARDPHWIYAHWDFTTAQQREYNRLAADGHLSLRVYMNVPSGAPHSEVVVHPESRDWFVHVGKGGAKYVAQVGYYDKRRKWQTISQSDATLTPPDSLAEDTTVRFATVPSEVPFEKLIQVVKAAAQAHLPLAQAIQEVSRVQAAAERGTTGAASEVAWAELQRALAGHQAGEWTPEQDHALAQLISMDTVRRVWIGSLEITELVRRQLVRELASQAAVPSLPGGPGAELGGLGALGSLASPFGGMGKAPAAKGFWFNVNAELIIYGATEPDATVVIGGRAIRLRPDGSFSYRFALPDGQYDLPIMAVSADKSEGRGADLRFSRSTEYQGEVGVHPQDPALQPPTPDHVE